MNSANTDKIYDNYTNQKLLFALLNISRYVKQKSRIIDIITRLKSE